MYAVHLSSAMSQPPDTPRKRLSRARVLEAAVALADEIGLEAFSMRRLAQELGVVPMALYKHFGNKDELLDDMVDVVFDEMRFFASAEDWRSALRRRAIMAREALKRHSWAIGLMESRHPGAGEPATPQRHDGLPARGGLLLRDGDPRLLGPGRLHLRLRPAGERSRIYDTRKRRQGRAGRADRIGGLDDYPYLAEIATRLPQSGYNSAEEFAWGLDLILDGLDRLR